MIAGRPEREERTAEPVTDTAAGAAYAHLTEVTARLRSVIAEWDQAWEALQAPEDAAALMVAHHYFERADGRLTRVEREHSLALSDYLSASRAEIDAIAADVRTLMAGWTR